MNQEVRIRINQELEHLIRNVSISCPGCQWSCYKYGHDRLERQKFKCKNKGCGCQFIPGGCCEKEKLVLKFLIPCVADQCTSLKNRVDPIFLLKKEVTEKPTEKICPKCGSQLLIRLGKFGKFYACSKFPKCKYTEPLEKNLLGIKCPKCKKGEIVEKRTKKRKIFYACNQFPKCDFALWDKPTGKKCPKCKSLLIQTKRGQIKCSNKECDYIIKMILPEKLKS